MVSMPPRHGKSEFTSKYFLAWYLGTWPWKRVILGGYESDFASSWGRKVRDLLTEYGEQAFGVTLSANSSAADRWEIARHGGGMQTAGVGGALTGKGADLLVIDDPVKNSEQAQSATYREKAWDWYASTAYTRLEPGGAVIVIQTRWHEDDLAGKILTNADDSEPWDVLNLPAIAEENDQLGRQPGQALWPERYNEADLARIQSRLGPFWWSALYQQRPSPREGNFFQPEWFEVVNAAPADARRVRFWDKAATAGAGDWTAGAKVAAKDGTYWIEDVRRVRLASGDRDKLIRQTAELDGIEVSIIGEQEPGSSGKDQALAFIKLLSGFPVRCVPATGSKEVRADPLASQAQAGNVKIVRGTWNKPFLDELASFPRGTHDDQVDAASGAFNGLQRTASRLFL
jgi:predicted phage terminase large subunit-like protein